MSVPFLIDLAFATLMLVWTTIEDVKTHTVTLLPILLGMAGGLIVSVILHGWLGLVGAAIGGLIGGGLGWLLVWGARLGEGDALLYMALGMIFGPATVMVIVGVSTLLVLIRFLKPILQKRKIRVAVAPYIAAGTVIALFVNHMA